MCKVETTSQAFKVIIVLGVLTNLPFIIADLTFSFIIDFSDQPHEVISRCFLERTSVRKNMTVARWLATDGYVKFAMIVMLIILGICSCRQQDQLMVLKRATIMSLLYVFNIIWQITGMGLFVKDLDDCSQFPSMVQSYLIALFALSFFTNIVNIVLTGLRPRNPEELVEQNKISSERNMKLEGENIKKSDDSIGKQKNQ